MRYLIIFLFILLSACQSTTKSDPSLGEYGRFIHEQTRYLGGSTVKIINLTPKSITFWYKRVYVSLRELSNASQYHCQKIGRSAVLISDEDQGYGGEMKANFYCE